MLLVASVMMMMVMVMIMMMIIIMMTMKMMTIIDIIIFIYYYYYYYYHHHHHHHRHHHHIANKNLKEHESLFCQDLTVNTCEKSMTPCQMSPKIHSVHGTGVQVVQSRQNVRSTFLRLSLLSIKRILISMFMYCPPHFDCFIVQGSLSITGMGGAVRFLVMGTIF